jgi:hypothetical protein
MRWSCSRRLDALRASRRDQFFRAQALREVQQRSRNTAVFFGRLSQQKRSCTSRAARESTDALIQTLEGLAVSRRPEPLAEELLQTQWRSESLVPNKSNLRKTQRDPLPQLSNHHLRLCLPTALEHFARSTLLQARVPTREGRRFARGARPHARSPPF